MGTNNVITSDYDNVKANIQKMEAEVDAMENALTKVLEAINDTSKWIGPDAIAYKAVLRNYANRIKKSSRWLKSLNKIVSSHSYKLFQRAVNDNSARNFR